MATAPSNSKPVRAARPDLVPPHDLDAEMALLGSMMMSRDAIAEVVASIQRSDSQGFYLPAHRHLFEVLLDLYDDPRRAIDLIVVSDELRRRNQFELVGGEEYMVQLAESFADWANAEYYARIVRDKGMLRDLIQCADGISHQAYSAIDEARDILDRAEQQLFDVTQRRVSGETVAVREAVLRLAKLLEDRGEEALTGVPTGFPALDEYTSGFQPGDLIIVAARPSMGKTALGLTMAQHLAAVEHRPCVFFSMEMSIDQVVHRLAAAQAGVETQRLRKRMLDDAETRRLLEACHTFQDAPLFIDDTPGMTATELRAKARRLKMKHDIQAVYVDYLQLMHMPGAESRQVEIANISRGLKSLGRELKVPIIAMAQLNRMPEGRQDKRPLMSDLRESGAIEQDADVILLIHREEYYRRDDEEVRGKAELIIAKQRNGPVGMVPLQFNQKLTRFAPLHMGPEYPGENMAPF